MRVGLFDLLDLVSCAATYGFDRDVFYDACADWLGNELSFEEIDAFAESYRERQTEGYTEEDVQHIRQELRRFRDRYCNKTITV